MRTLGPLRIDADADLEIRFGLWPWIARQCRHLPSAGVSVLFCPSLLKWRRYADLSGADKPVIVQPTSKNIILVVDDEQIVARLATTALAAEG